MAEYKKLPLGIQSFSEIITEGYLYVDKTAYIHQLVSTGKLYFLSRPRRFGKSVLISTLEALFRGHRELFEGLFIENRWNWQPQPVIRLDMLGLKNHSLTALEDSLKLRLDEQAASYGLQLTASDSNDRLRELIIGLARQGRVMVLIDEYDKPILDQISNLERAEENRRFLAGFYAVLKSLEEKLGFLLMTGVSKFTHVSLFSELNNLEDLTLQSAYAGIAGYTEEELDKHLGPYLQGEIEGYTGQALRARIKDWYNGYSWDGKTCVYNPVSVLNLIKQQKFAPYWFSTGTPTFLIELLRKEMIDISELDRMEIGDLAMNGFEPDRIDPRALLFQTGYLTIESVTPSDFGSIYQMTYPNREVKRAFLAWLLADFSGKKPDHAGLLATQIGASLKRGDIDAFMEGIQGLFTMIPYNIFISRREAYYHTVIYLALSLTGVPLACEIQTHKGRIDAVLETDTCFFITEFKLGTARDAIDQIREKDYAAAYRNKGKTINLLGIGMDPEQRNITDWLCLPDESE